MEWEGAIQIQSCEVGRRVQGWSQGDEVETEWKEGRSLGSKWLAETKRKVTCIHGDPHVIQEREEAPDLRMTVGG